MYEAFLLSLISSLSLLIGLIGVAIIVIGCFKALYYYVITRDEHNFQHIRLILASHIVLGLDFMVGKDIIDTLLLDTGATLWQDLASLITVVAVRITLTHFMLQEVKYIRNIEGNAAKK